MAYNAANDEVITEQTEDEITIGVYRYNGGPVKVGIRRTITKRNGEIQPAKLGRLTVDEARFVAEQMPAMLEMA